MKSPPRWRSYERWRGACWGFNTGDSTLVHVVLGIGVPVLAVALWGIFAAPKSSRRLQGGVLWAFKVVFFALASVALVAVAQSTVGIALGVIAAVNLVLLYVWQQ
ncbi:MAG: YrdB family protein [Anaerolineae bacterium]|nr:YrdB family protein [Anaerolineae bacterium]